MRHARSLTTTADALQHVFNVPVKASYRPALSAGLHPFTLPSRQQSSTSTFRPYNFEPAIGQSSQPSRRPDRPTRRPFQPREVDISKFGPRDLDRPPRDEEIQAWRAYLRLPNKKLSEPQIFQDILDGRARDEKGKFSQFVQELAPPDPHNNRPYSIVAYYDKKEMKDRELAVKKKAKEGKTKEKALELGWSIGEHDLQQRMNRLKEFLEKGARVEVIFGSPRIRGWSMKRKVSEEEGLELLGKIRGAAMEVQGTKEVGGLTGLVLGQARLTFQGPGKKGREKGDDGKETDKASQ